jgi:hypothetical protein
MPDLGDPWGDAGWRPRVEAQFRNLQRLEARDIARHRGIDPDRVRTGAITLEQLQYKLCRLEPPVAARGR